jgi:hypothetical protein
MWFGYLALQGINFGLIGLGILLIICGGWWLVTAPVIWDDYLKYYKKLPKKKRTVWNEPKRVYYNLSVYLFIPASIVLGMLFIYLAWLQK